MSTQALLPPLSPLSHRSFCLCIWLPLSTTFLCLSLLISDFFLPLPTHLAVALLSLATPLLPFVFASTIIFILFFFLPHSFILDAVLGLSSSLLYSPVSRFHSATLSLPLFLFLALPCSPSFFFLLWTCFCFAAFYLTRYSSSPLLHFSLSTS